MNTINRFLNTVQSHFPTILKTVNPKDKIIVAVAIGIFSMFTFGLWKAYSLLNRVKKFDFQFEYSKLDVRLFNLIHQAVDDGCPIELFHPSIRKDIQFCRLIVDKNPMNLHYVDKSLPIYEELACKAVSKYLSAFHEIHPDVKNSPIFQATLLQHLRESGENVTLADLNGSQVYEFNEPTPEAILSEFSRNGNWLKIARPDLQADIEVVHASIRSDGRLIRSSPIAQNDPESVRIAVKQHWSNFRFASQALKNDLIFVQEMCQISGNVLRYLDGLKSHTAVVREAFVQNFRTFCLSSDELKNDEDFILELAKIHGSVIKYMNPRLHINEAIIKAAVESDGAALKHVLEIMKTREVVLNAVRQNPHAARFAPEEYWGDEEFVNIVVPRIGIYLQCAHPSFRQNVALARQAVKENAEAYQYVDPSIQFDEEIVMHTIKRRTIDFTRPLPSHLQTRKNAFEAVKYNPYALRLFPQLNDDLELVCMALRKQRLSDQLDILKGAHRDLQEYYDHHRSKHDLFPSSIFDQIGRVYNEERARMQIFGSILDGKLVNCEFVEGTINVKDGILYPHNNPSLILLPHGCVLMKNPQTDGFKVAYLSQTHLSNDQIEKLQMGKKISGVYVISKGKLMPKSSDSGA